MTVRELRPISYNPTEVHTVTGDSIAATSIMFGNSTDVKRLYPGVDAIFLRWTQVKFM